MGPPSPMDLAPSLPSFSATAEDTIVEGSGARARPEPSFGRGDSIGRYLLIDPLGRGAMGQVFRAYDPDLDRQVALKILHERTTHGPEARKRLLGEAKAMARIHHPHVVTVYDAGMHEGAVFIAMEVVDGPSLDHWLATPRSPAAILDALTDAARGLAAAHAAGVIHRDFKPANVLVTADGRAKVGDFGLAGIAEPTTGSTEAEPGRAMGTPAYMSPEHFAGVGIDARSDQFSFAIALHEALHGARPFSATTWPELAVQVVSGDVTAALAGRRGGIDGVLRRALAVDPAQRFASMDALIAALERARRPVWRRWAAAAALVLAAGLVALVGRDEADACVPGTRRVAESWGPSAQAALRIGGSDYTDRFSREARDRFVEALDGYATQWAAAYDASCAAVGPRAQRGTPPAQRTAQCLENRLDSLRGLAELATSERLDAGRVDDLAGTLPVLDDCTSGDWVPYPPEPERAAIAAELHRELGRIRRLRLNDRGDTAVPDAEALVARARALDDAYLLALALRERACVVDEVPNAPALLQEALERAVAGGHDALAADIINEVLLTQTHGEQRSTPEIAHLVATARGLVARSGGDERQLGNLALNEASLLRRAGRIDEAIARDLQAEAHFASIGDEDGVARARVNQLVSLMRLGQAERVSRELPRTVQALEEASGATSPAASQGRSILYGALSYAGRMHEAFAVADASYQQVRELFTPQSYTFRQAAIAHVMAAANIGRTDIARETLVFARAAAPLPEDKALALDVVELVLLESEREHDEILRRLPVLAQRAARLHDDETAMTLDMMGARSLFLLGRHDEARAALASPSLLRLRDGTNVLPDLLSDLAMLGVVSGAPPPPGHTWRSIAVAEKTPMLTNRRLLEAAAAIASAPDPVPLVREVRDELARVCHPNDVDVQLLDAWLATRERHATP